jgi:hypothetical protein
MTMRNSFPIFNGFAPRIDPNTNQGGPKGLPIHLDFAALGTSIHIDLVQEEQNGAIDFVQSVWIDNASNLSSLTLTFQGTGQRIVVPAQSQNLYPVIASSPCVFTATTAGGVAVDIICINVPMPLAAWGPFTVNANLDVVRGTFASADSFIAVGGTSQIALPINAARKRFEIFNPSSAAGQNIGAAETLFVNYTNAAGVNDGTSFELFPGASFDTGYGPVTTQAITVNAATTNHRFACKEM